MNVFCLDESIRRSPSDVAVLSRDATMTFGELDSVAEQITVVLRDSGCMERDRVILALPDSLEFISAMVGVQRLGAVAVPVVPGLPGSHYQSIVDQTGASILLCEPLLAKQIRLASLLLLILEIRPTPWSLHWQISGSKPAARLREFVVPADLALLLYTSGSTGRAKCVMHSHRSIAAACKNVGSDLLGLKPTDRVLCIPKPSFAYGLGFGVFFPLAAGALTIVTSRPPDILAAADLLRRLRPTVLCAVPSFLAVLLQRGELSRDDLACLRFITSAGEPLSPRLYEMFKTRFGVEVLDGIGATETLTHFISNRPGMSVVGTCGTEIRDCEVSLLDQSEKPVANGVTGTLYVKGPTNFLGYWEDAESTAAVLRDRRLLLRDTLYVDSKGHYVYCGRQDDMLKISGVWVSTTDVQDAICSLDGVLEAFVTTREDERARRRLVAYVVPKSGIEITSTEILLGVRSLLSTDSLPSAIVILGKLARTMNGKVSRSDLPAPVWYRDSTG